MSRFGQLLKGVSGLCSAFSKSLRTHPTSICSQMLQKNSSPVNLTSVFGPYFGLLARCKASLYSMHRHGGRWVKSRPSKNPLGYNVPFAKGVVIRPVIRKPKKPNSANRKCVLVRLSTGKETVAYVPGEGHNLQEHNIVLVRVGRLKDCPGVKVRCVRGKYDLPHVEKKRQQL